MRTVTIASILLAGLASASCRDLPTVDAGTCGNKIVDADEDCDGDATLPEDGTSCRAPGGVGACRFDCGAGSACPTGYVCGSDAICRAHSGAFTDVGTSVPLSPTHLLVDDFDGDGRSDVLAYTSYASEVRALFFEPSGAPATSVSMASDNMVPAVGKLATDAPSTFTFATRAGLGVMRGQTDRSFSPTPYSTLQLPWEDGHVVVLDAMLPADTPDPIDDPYLARWLGDEAIIFHRASAYVIEDVDLDPIHDDKSTFRLPRNDDPVGPMPVGDVDVDPVASPCQEIALTYGDDKVYIVTPCVRQADGKLVWNRKVGPGGDPIKTYPPVTLFDQGKNPVSAKISAVLLTQLNAPAPGQPATAGLDEYLDLVIDSYDGQAGESHIYVAFGLGNGQFYGPLPNAETIPNGAVDIGVIGTLGELLAVGDINLDSRADFVFPTGVVMSGAAGAYGLAAVPQRAAWTDAAIADLNGDGRPDVICGSSTAAGIDFFTNAGGGALNPLVIPTDAGATSFVVGDFDGDLTQDVAFRLVALTGDVGATVSSGETVSSTTPDSLGVIFGRFGQTPEAPKNLGQLGHIDQIVTGRTIVAEQPADAISDLGVVSRSLTGNGPPSAAVFQGRSDRLLQSPFGLNVPGQDPFSDKFLISTTIGQFDESDGTSHLDVVALVREQSFKTVPDGTDPPVGGAADRYFLWLLPATGAASLDLATAKPIELAGEKLQDVDWASAQLATIDIDDDGQDEVALVMPSYDTSAQDFVLTVAVAKRGSDGKPALAGPFVLSDERSYPSFGGVASPGGGVEPTSCYNYDARPQISVADVDGDGKKDLVTYAYDASGATRVVVLWSTGDADHPFDEGRGHVTIPDDACINAYATANIDQDLASELVVLGSAGAYSVDFDGRTPSTPVLLDGVETGSVVASGDFDGDGIADLVVATSADVRLYRGKPVIQ